MAKASAQTDSLLKVTCNIYNNLIDSLVDTGASTNYISQQLINKISKEKQLNIIESSNSVQIGDKTIIRSNGHVILDVYINDIPDG